MRLSQGLAVAYALDGRFEQARRAIDWALAQQERDGHRERLTDLHLGARWIRDSIIHMAEDFDGALAGLLETNAMAGRAPNRTVRCGTAGTIAQILFVRGQYAEAQRWADEALEIAEAIANMGALPAAAALALATRLERGERVAAERYLDAIERGQTAGDSMQTNVRFAGDALLALDDRARIERQVAWLQQNHGGGRLREAYMAAALGDLLLRLDQQDQAERAFAHALALAESIGARVTAAGANLGLAELAAVRGDRPDAARRLETVLPVLEELRLGRYLTRAARLLARDRTVRAGA
jgi:tetratricopeptide (TPR) repeat protein